MSEAGGPAEILPFLLLGSFQDSLRPKLLERLKVTHILDVKFSARRPENEKIEFLHVPLSDCGDTGLEKVLERCCVFIDEARNKQGGRVLVHCSLGSNRAPTVVIAYLMSREQQTLRESYALVCSKRSIVAVHEDYFFQLQELERKLRGRISLSEAERGESVQEFIRKLRGQS